MKQFESYQELKEFVDKFGKESTDSIGQIYVCCIDCKWIPKYRFWKRNEIGQLYCGYKLIPCTVECLCPSIESVDIKFQDEKTLKKGTYWYYRVNYRDLYHNYHK